MNNSTNAPAAAVSGDVQPRPNDTLAKFSHANHGTNYMMPFYHECMGEFQEAMFNRAEKRAGTEVATELFDVDKGVCAYNHNTKMVFAPKDISPEAKKTLAEMGVLTSILVCVRVGFLWSLLVDSGNYNKQNQASITDLFRHMRKEHNAVIFVIGYEDEELFEDNVLRRFINNNGLKTARTDIGKGLSSAITNAKYAMGSEEIFSRTLYMDNIGNEPDEGFESGFRVAAEGHAAPLISRYIARCPKCCEPWTGYRAGR